MKASYLDAFVEIQGGWPVNMMDTAASMQSGKVREIFDWDLTVCVYIVTGMKNWGQ